MKIGLDVGSTTLKCVILDDNENIVFRKYGRHCSQIKQNTIVLLKDIKNAFPQVTEFGICISGSAGIGLSQTCMIPFVQEVYATRIAVNKLVPTTDVAIELGGEDAKILFLTNSMEVRMNGSCAGGTGAFIDQMATLLSLSPDEMNELAKLSDKLYSIASRCGVFAKSDIQPLLNQGAQKSDISASIFNSVVNQTIAGLAQGRQIKDNVVYLGGPLTFLSELRNSFDRSLDIQGTCPEDSLYFVSLGAAYFPEKRYMNLDLFIDLLLNNNSENSYAGCPPLFNGQEEYRFFKERHQRNSVEYTNPATYTGESFIGVDAGSTTVKATVIDIHENILYSEYLPNSGNPVPIIKDFLENFYTTFPNISVKSSAVTGYGEEIIKNAFKVDHGIVETIAHFTAAKKFKPDVDFIVDIGGQDIKCFKIKNGIIESIFLNEACSSGCGSFLQTFAAALNYPIEDFVNLGLFANHPVDLGSRCTVFMNSSVKQAQKDGARIEDISAGLSISVVKNAIYKVIRAPSTDSLGENIIVQGGTFLNDAVLRSFEQEIGKDVVRPNISGLMGAYGAALYAKSHTKDVSTILSHKELKKFTHNVKTVTCGKCSNNCRLTVNTFDNDRKFIGGNRCEKPLAKTTTKSNLNIYDYKLSLLNKYLPIKGIRGKIGIPMGLNMYELLPFWHSFFTTLGFEVVTSPRSNRKMYLQGQNTIPSDTVCFPAKLLHGHIEWLISQGITNIFYPCMTYNLDEGLGDNHYNCPVVAYYPEVIAANVPSIGNICFIYDYIGLHRPQDFNMKIYNILCKYFTGINLSEVKTAAKIAFEEYNNYLQKVRDKGDYIIAQAKKNDQDIIILAGRPYHIDPEINHGIDKLICECGAAVISEDVVSNRMKKFGTEVLNQWTYHSRLYSAAKYIANEPNMHLIQLVSFGCGVDAITTDEVREILENEGKIYTQIKIDDITNLGAVKIRLRSLFASIPKSQE